MAQQHQAGPEPTYVASVTTPEVACEGVPGEQSHPVVFMAFDHEREVMCPYCSRRYRLADDAPLGQAH